MTKLYKTLTLALPVILLLISNAPLFAQDRVDDDIQLLYNFMEGQGAYINDISGNGSPMILHIEDPENTNWLSGGGLEITSPTIIKSFSHADKVNFSIPQSGELTMEAWIKPSNLDQDGPARIMTCSYGSLDRNFTMAQNGDEYNFRVRTNQTSDNGTPEMETSNNSAENSLQHIVYTLDNEGNETIFINGLEESNSTRPGQMTNWSDEFRFAIGNEFFADRDWLGEIYLSAVYSRALSAQEVEQNFNAGHIIDGPETSVTLCSGEDCFIDGFGEERRALWMPALPNGVYKKFKFDEDGGHMDVFEDGTCHLYGSTVNLEDPDYGWFIDLWFKDRMNWEEWSALGRGWKGDPNLVEDHYLDWDYYIMDPDLENTFIGLDNFEGSQIFLTHRPSNLYYGFQVGVAANDQNAEPGMSCWFDYSGTILGQEVNHHGDVNLEGECDNLPVIQCVSDIEISCEDSFDPEFTGTPTVNCPEEYTLEYTDEIISEECPWIIIRHWTATNSLGDVIDCDQEITMIDEQAPIILAESSINFDCEINSLVNYEVIDECDPNPVVTVIVLDSAWVSSDDCITGQLRTQTQGGWGTNPNGNNPGVYLNNNFDSAFPDGLTIGCNNTMTLTSAQAVRDFLPSGSSPSLLPTGALINPGGAYNNVLAGQLVAATLSTTFDSYDENFGDSDFALDLLIIQEGDFMGWQVGDLLEEANNVIGGCPSDYSPSEINNVLSSINENYVDGSTDNGFLACNMPWDCYFEYNVIITATDQCGNSSESSMSIIVVDDESPELSNEPIDITVNCGEIPDPEILINNECFDELVNFSVIDTEFSGPCFPTIQRVYSLSDQCGNSIEYVQYITVVDNESPVVINELQDLVLECGEDIPSVELEVEDNCDLNPSIEFTEETIDLDCGFVIYRTWTVMDECGNFIVVDQSIESIDSEPPVPTIDPIDLFADCSEIPELEDLEFTDNCDPNFNLVFEENQIGEGCDYVIMRTWTATDACGNESIVQQIITVSDDSAPIFTHIPEDVEIDCGEDIPDNMALAADNCSSSEVCVAEEYLDLGCGQIIRTWTASDDCGNESTATQTITLVDNESPLFIGVPEDLTLACGNLPEVPLVTASDNCSIDLLIEFNEEQTILPCGLQVVRTWTTSDDCGNIAMQSQLINLNDETSPVFLGNDFVEIQCGFDTNTSLLDVYDDCSSNLEVSWEDAQAGSGCSYQIVRTYTAVDACGNTETFVQTIQVSDNEAPVFTNIPPDMNASCDGSPFLEEASAEDNCSSVEMQYNEEYTGEGCSLQLQRTWISTDECGNEAIAQQVISFQDNEAPTIIGVPEDVELACTDEIPDAPSLTALDNCSENPSLNFFEEEVPGNCENAYAILRTWIATDDCGNQTIESQSIDIIDNVQPVFDQELVDLQVECGFIPDPPFVSASDNCGGEVTVVLDETTAPGGCPNITRTWTATDACGNSASMMQTVFIEDNEPPLITGIPDDMEVDCNSIPEMPEPEVSDNCDNEVALSVNESVVGSGCEFTIIRTWIASDDCGNTTIVSQSINVEDTSDPVFVDVPEEITIDCSELEDLPYPSVVDDCGATITTEYEDQVIGGGCSYDIIRTYTATDLCGHSAVAEQVIHVVDNTAPVFIGGISGQWIECSELTDAEELLVEDGCSSEVEISFNESQIGEGCSYQVVRTWIATDECGNSASFTQNIFVSDTTAPEFSDIEEEIQLNCNDEIPVANAPSVSDNCSVNVDLAYVEFSETNNCTETITRIWTATDECGNSSSSQQLVVISDTEAPIVSGVPEDLMTTCDNIPAVEDSPSATDNCSENIEVSFSELILDGECPYTIIRSWTATDDCGNSTVVSQEITVYDPEAPLLENLPFDVEVECGNVPDVAEVTASDNCDSDLQFWMEETWHECSCQGILRRTWRAIDKCGNMTEHTQNIIITDTSAPEFVDIPEDMTTSCDDVPPLSELDVIDNCSSTMVLMEEIISPSDCPSEYVLERIWTAYDACGNINIASQTITVIDETAPSFEDFPEDMVVGCGEIPEVPELVIMDECDDTIELTFNEEIILLEEADNSCDLGNSETLAGDVAIWLPSLSSNSANYVFIEAGGVMEQDLENGTAHLYGQVFNTDNPNQSWIIDFYLQERQDWENWSANGGSYKDEMELAGDNYLDWSYYKLADNSTLTGAGDFEGSLLNLTHAPSDFTYGFQMGMAANNRNSAFGMSGWFFYEGDVNGDPVEGVGDLMTENNCCPEQDIIRTWTLIDCAGNESVYTQVIHVENPFDFEPSMMEQQLLNVFDVSGSTADEFNLEFTTSNDGDVVIKVFNITGEYLDGISFLNVKKGVTRSLKYPKKQLPAGIYIFQMNMGEMRLTDRDVVE